MPVVSTTTETSIATVKTDDLSDLNLDKLC